MIYFMLVIENLNVYTFANFYKWIGIFDLLLGDKKKKS